MVAAGYAIAAFILGGGTAWLAYDINRRLITIQDSRRDIMGRNSAADQVLALRNQFQQARGELPFLQSLLPIQDQLINFPREAGVIARQKGVEFGFVFGASIAGDETAPGAVAFTASAKGTINNILDFLTAFESNKYLIGLDALTISANEEKTYQAIINGKIFTQ